MQRGSSARPGLTLRSALCGIAHRARPGGPRYTLRGIRADSSRFQRPIAVGRAGTAHDPAIAEHFCREADVLLAEPTKITLNPTRLDGPLIREYGGPVRGERLMASMEIKSLIGRTRRGPLRPRGKLR